MLRFEKFLTDKKILNDDLKKKVAADITAEIDEAVEFAEASPYPKPEDAADFVWS